METSTGRKIVGWKFVVVFSVSVILLGVGGFVIRNRLLKIGGDASPAASFERKGVVLRAEPNPEPESVKTTIIWSTPSDAFVQIFVNPPGNSEGRLFAEGGHGSIEVNWIKPDREYEFRMYAGKERKELLAVLKIPDN